MDSLLDSIRGLGDGRHLIGIAGAPASGKSTLADDLAARLGRAAVVVPMDGFHLDNSVLRARDLVNIKGAPETFDVDGFSSLLLRIRDDRADVFCPIFDRSADLSRNAAQLVGTAHQVILVEGNYLLLDRPGWRELRPLFDLTVMLDVPMPELERRLIQRWLDHGLDADAAMARARSNDIPNAQAVMRDSAKADMVV